MRPSRTPHNGAQIRSKTHTFSGAHASSNELGNDEMALLTLSHTTVEHQLYEVMLREISLDKKNQGVFSVRRLMQLTGLNSYSTVRRGRNGLLNKKSIEANETDRASMRTSVYTVFKPPEIFSRRRAAGIAPYPKELASYANSSIYSRALERVLDDHNLSRREAQVALACVEGLTNAEIGARLIIRVQTVKFHLSHIFVKLGVRRRAELVSRLLAQEAR
jgi:DNA-binding CsgD family transcriptional regulator